MVALVTKSSLQKDREKKIEKENPAWEKTQWPDLLSPVVPCSRQIIQLSFIVFFDCFRTPSYSFALAVPKVGLCSYTMGIYAQCVSSSASDVS